jgi:hypothetical protein
MSNTYSTNLLLPNPGATVAGKFVDYQTPQRIANSSNYSFAVGNTHNALSQSYADKTFIQSSSSFIEMSEWRIPLCSLEHDNLEIVVHYDIIGTSSNCNLRFTLEVGAASSNITINLPSASIIASSSLTISFPASDQYYGTLTLEAQADSSNNAEVELKSIMARWSVINSPISAGIKKQYQVADNFTPSGTSRTGINQALTSRLAHNIIDNVNILRERFRSYLNWSSCYSANSTIFSSLEDAAASEVFLGVGHISTLMSYPLAPSGFDNLSHRKLELHIKHIGDFVNTEFDFFGNRIVLSASPGVVSWSIHTIEMDYGRISRRGDILLPYYSASLDNSTKNYETLVNYGNIPLFLYPIVNSSNYGMIISMNLMGI